MRRNQTSIAFFAGVDLGGAFLGAKHAARVMLPQRPAQSACTAIAGISTHSYAASKYGILGLAKNLAAELGQYGLRVNCVSPYGLMTGMGTVHLSEAEITQAEMGLSEMGHLRGQILKADSVARAALYLASDEAN
ncbi:hypothetical protein L1049_008564 [Liquidambar formosana]|uniref:Uncharacterized protein n=1 Tax=Liquidambar formosana TaxID=63359 RepID=A0AAP0X988_LIQFO